MSSVGKSAGFQTRSDQGQLLIETFLLHCLFGISTCRLLREHSKVRSIGNPVRFELRVKSRCR